MPELTSIKVTPAVRDRLALAASERGMTMRSLVDELSRAAADQAHLSRAGREMAAVRDQDPQSWQDYLDDGRDWDQGSSDPVGA